MSEFLNIIIFEIVLFVCMFNRVCVVILNNNMRKRKNGNCC